MTAPFKITPQGVWIVRLGPHVSFRWDRKQGSVYMNFWNQRFELKKIKHG